MHLLEDCLESCARSRALTQPLSCPSARRSSPPPARAPQVFDSCVLSQSYPCSSCRPPRWRRPSCPSLVRFPSHRGRCIQVHHQNHIYLHICSTHLHQADLVLYLRHCRRCLVDVEGGCGGDDEEKDMRFTAELFICTSNSDARTGDARPFCFHWGSPAFNSTLDVARSTLACKQCCSLVVVRRVSSAMQFQVVSAFKIEMIFR